MRALGKESRFEAGVVSSRWLGSLVDASLTVWFAVVGVLVLAAVLGVVIALCIVAGRADRAGNMRAPLALLHGRGNDDDV